MLSSVLQGMTIGKQVEFNGEKWILLSNLGATVPSGDALFLAVRANDNLPSQVHVITAPADSHLK